VEQLLKQTGARRRGLVGAVLAERIRLLSRLANETCKPRRQVSVDGGLLDGWSRLLPVEEAQLGWGTGVTVRHGDVGIVGPFT